MKKLRKIVAAVLAAATVVAVATISAGAVTRNNVGNYELTYYAGSAPTIHYSKLQYMQENNIHFTNSIWSKYYGSNQLIEGTKFLNVDFSADPTARKKKTTLNEATKMNYMEDLYLYDGDGMNISELKYPVAVTKNSSCIYTLMLESKRTYQNFDITKVSMKYNSSWSGGMYEVYVDFKISDKHILTFRPDLVLNAKQSTSGNVVDVQFWGTPNDNPSTTGQIKYLIRPWESGEMNVEYCGITVGSIFVPNSKSSNMSLSFLNT